MSISNVVCQLKGFVQTYRFEMPEQRLCVRFMGNSIPAKIMKHIVLVWLLEQ